VPPKGLDGWPEVSRTRFSVGSKVSKDPVVQKLAADASYILKTVVRQDLDDCDEMMNISRAGEVFTLEGSHFLRSLAEVHGTKPPAPKWCG
jgi:hypothetical protein